MGVWNWVFEFAAQARARGDAERARLLEIQLRASAAGKSDPDGMLAALREGRLLAERLDERWWVLQFDHWRLQALLPDGDVQTIAEWQEVADDVSHEVSADLSAYAGQEVSLVLVVLENGGRSLEARAFWLNAAIHSGQ